MDEDLSIINNNTRNEKIKNFLFKYKKTIISICIVLFLIIISFYSVQIYKDSHRKLISDKYNEAIIKYENKNEINIVITMREIIEERDSAYSPLALYFLIDNNLINNNKETNELFDILIEKTSLDDEIKNLIIYKKGLYNADLKDENDLLDILKPVINSNSVWKSHALYLMGEFFYSRNEKQKAKEFFNQVVNTDNANQNIFNEARKRLNRDLSE
tara:strand:- start:327 stop:971 length:645 start_codon:yes stop_codon:yes gene_type:complete